MEENNKEKNGMPRFNLTWLYVILLIVLGIAWFSSSDDSASKSATYTEFKEYVEKGYANKIVANKDEGSLKMYVTTEHIRDVFKNIGIRSLVAALVVFLLTVAATFVGGIQLYNSTKESIIRLVTMVL